MVICVANLAMDEAVQVRFSPYDSHKPVCSQHQRKVGEVAGCWIETQARVGQEQFRRQPIESGLLVACGYGRVIGPGVAVREGYTESHEMSSVMVKLLYSKSRILLPPTLSSSSSLSSLCQPVYCINAKNGNEMNTIFLLINYLFADFHICDVAFKIWKNK